MCFLDCVIKTRFWEPSDYMLRKMFDQYTPSAEGLQVKTQSGCLLLVWLLFEVV